MAKTSLIVLAVAGMAIAAGVLYWSTQRESATGADAGDPVLIARGAAVYSEHCASCHGANLEGQANWRQPLPDGGLPAPPHDASGHTWHHPDRLLFEVTKFGGQAQAPPGFRSNMPGFSDKLTDGDVWAVLAYIKSRWPEEVRRRHRAINERFE